MAVNDVRLTALDVMGDAPVIPVIVLHGRGACRAAGARAGGRRHPHAGSDAAHAGGAGLHRGHRARGARGRGRRRHGAQRRRCAGRGAWPARASRVSPGYTRAVGKACHDLGLPLLPGVATGSEIMTAQEDGYTELKFFPARAGRRRWRCSRPGKGPFGDVKFCPTGGITAANAREFLALANVVCVGGSWLTPADAMAQGDWARITQLAREAVALQRAP